MEPQYATIFRKSFMGTAILQGLLRRITQSKSPTVEYTAWVRSQTSLQRLHDTLGEDKKHVKCVAGGDITEIIKPANLVILGFPPGELKAVFGVVGLVEKLRGKLIVSLLAGVSYEQIQDAAARNLHLLRVIPSIGAKINDSVTLMAETTFASPEQLRMASWMFEQLGEVQWLPESLMDEATAAGAACNGLIMVAVDAIVDASVAEGIPRSAAMKLAAANLRSSSGLLLGGGMRPELLKESMSVPKGITINSVLALERGHVRSAISDAVRQAIHYTRNM
ncbi:MAG: hypothetical protein Q9200_000203 [Gallowayella weberi]